MAARSSEGSHESVLGGSRERGAPEDSKSVGTQVENGWSFARGVYVVEGNRCIRRDDFVYSAISILDKGVERQQQPRDLKDEVSLHAAA